MPAEGSGLCDGDACGGGGGTEKEKKRRKERQGGRWRRRRRRTMDLASVLLRITTWHGR